MSRCPPPCALRPYGVKEALSILGPGGRGEVPCRVPSFVLDPLGMFAGDFGLARGDVLQELDRLLGSRKQPEGYADWMELVQEVKRPFIPSLPAAAFRTLTLAAREEYDLHDPYVLEFIFTALVTVRMPGDPVWGFIVGPPSALKTEFLRWLYDLPLVYTLSRLTAHSLISGLKTGVSLLPELDGRVLVIKDFTTVLEGDRKAREEIFAQLRDSFDGYCEAFFGTIGKLSFRARFHVLAAVTPAIEEYWSVQSSLGARFLKVRVPLMDGFDRCLAHGGREEEIRLAFARRARAVVDHLDPRAWEGVRFDRVQELRPVVELLARGRTHVSRYDGQIASTPEPEMLPRLTKQLRKLAVGRAVLYGRMEVDGSDLEFTRRVAMDTLPATRSRILRALCLPSTVEQLRYTVRLPAATLYRHLEDLEALELVSGDGQKPETFRLCGVAAQVVTPHTREKMARDHLPKEVGGDQAAPAGEALSWQETGSGGTT